MKNISILGSTGSIGKQSLDVLRNLKDEYRVSVLSCRNSIFELASQIEEFKPSISIVDNAICAKKLKDILDSKGIKGTEIMYGSESLANAPRLSGSNVVINALLGISGLVPTYSALSSGCRVILANKETMVTGGKIIMDKAREVGLPIIPIDSEHSAIFQCLQGNYENKIKNILLTASGGPFRGFTRERLKNVTLEEALKHPNWSMGRKITIDSATLMNKGLEVIEARWLFDVPIEKITVLVHPQSIIHSMVEFEDRSIIGQMGVADMRIPISYALSYPKRLNNSYESVDFFKLKNGLTFEEPDLKAFGCLRLAYEALKIGGDATVVLNASNEVLVDAFLNNKIGFTDIEYYVEKALDTHSVKYNPSLLEIIETDKKVREDVLNKISSL